MKTKLLVLAFLACLIATSVSAQTDPELQALRDAEVIRDVVQSMELRLKRLEEAGLTSYALGQCSSAPRITLQTSISELRSGLNKTFNTWNTCTSAILGAEQRRKSSDGLIASRTAEIGKLDIVEEVNKVCGIAPVKPQDRSAVEAEKYQLKTKIWVECGKKLIDSAKAEAEKREKEEAREQELEREKKAEEQKALEDAQKAINEAGKLIESRKINPAPVAPRVEKQVEKPKEVVTGSLATTTPAEKPVESVETKPQTSKVRQVFKKLFNFLWWQ